MIVSQVPLVSHRTALVKSQASELVTSMISPVLLIGLISRPCGSILVAEYYPTNFFQKWAAIRQLTDRFSLQVH